MANDDRWQSGFLTTSLIYDNHNIQIICPLKLIIPKNNYLELNEVIVKNDYDVKLR